METLLLEKEKTLIVWWAPDAENEKVFVLPTPTVEMGVQTIQLLSAYDSFLDENDFRVRQNSNGALGFMGEDGEIIPWSITSIAHGGKQFTDPFEYLEAKYSSQQIIT